MASTVMNLPRAPVEIGKSGNLDAPDGYKRAITSWRESTRTEALENLRMNPEYEEAPKYCELLEGRHWPRRRPKYRSQFVDNLLALARIEKLSLLTDIRPTIDVGTKGPSYQQQAAICRNYILYEWADQSLDLELLRVLDHALLGGGYWKIDGHFPVRRPNVLSITSCGMDEVIPIRPTFDLQEGPGIIYRAYRTLQFLQNKWPRHGEAIARQSARSRYTEYPTGARPNFIPEITWNALNPGVRQLYLARTVKSELVPAAQTFPALELEEYWIDDPSINEYPNEVTVKDPDLDLSEHNYWYAVPPKHRLFPRKRLIIFVGDEPVYDGPNPYWCGLYPFAYLTLNPIVWKPGGLSIYRNIVPINLLVDKLGAGAEDTIERKMNPNMRFKEGAVRPSDFRNYFPDLPGLKLLTTPMSQPGDVGYLEHPDVPPSLWASMEYLMNAFGRHSGTLDPTQLGRKKQVPGGETIEQMRDSMQAQFRLESRFVEAFLRQVGHIAISHIFQFANMEARISILGPDGITWEDFDYNPGTMVPVSEPKEDYWKNFAMRIASGSTHGASQDRSKQVAISLARMGLISTRHLLRTLDLPVDQIMEEIAEERKAGLGPMMGRTPRLTTGAKSGRSPI